MSQMHAVLSGTRRYQRAGTEVLGRADRQEWCELTVKVRRKEPLPAPSLSGKAVLDREELAERYGAAPEDLDKVEQVLDSYGIQTVAKDAATRTVKVAGTAEAMEKAFNVHLFQAQHEGHSFRSRVGDIYVPQELQGIVTSVFGLDTRRMARKRAVASAQPARHALPPASARPWFLPQELATLYGFPEGDGAGQTIGLIELGGSVIPSDLSQFASLAQISPTPEVEVVDVETIASKDRNDPGAIEEVMLDVDVVCGVCPAARIVAYFSNFSEKGWVDVLDAAVHDSVRAPSVLSVSWGLAEGQFIWTDQAIATINDSLQAAAALGITVCVAAGDDGSDDQVGDGLAHVDFPASSPFVLSVGGTNLLKRKGAVAGESVWKQGDGLRQDGGGSTGGGVSAVNTRPDWQKNITIDSVNPGAIPGRVVPDVAAHAAAQPPNGTGYFFVANGRPGLNGGTSAATPLWASLIARLNAARGPSKPVHFLTPVLYQPTAATAGKPLGAVACNDITQGDNITAAAGGYSAATGYDAVTGWGSPNGAKLLQLIP